MRPRRISLRSRALVATVAVLGAVHAFADDRTTAILTRILGVFSDPIAIVETDVRERKFAELPYGMQLAGGDHVVVGNAVSQHQAKRANIVGGISPVALRVEVP